MSFRRCKTAETDVGMLYYLSGADGTGGRLRSQAEDFIVDEISSRPEPSDDGKFTIATVKATNWETNRMVRLMARQLGMSRERIAFAGTKDKRAVTTQLMSFMCPPSQLRKVSLRDVEISGIYTSRRGMSLGDLVGNRFAIRVAETEKSGQEIVAETESVRADVEGSGGFPNYFGVQRFGVFRPITHKVGERLVRGDVRGAVRCYICGPAAETSRDTGAAEMRKKLAESDDWSGLIHEVPDSMSFERTMISYLMDNPGDYIGSVRILPTNLQMMFVHAYQSYLFNLMLSERIGRGLPLNRPVPGDIVCPIDRDGIPDHGCQIPASDENLDLVDRQVRLGRAFVTHALYGSRSALAEGEPGEIERKIVSDAGLRAQDFSIPGLQHCSSEGGRREIVCPVKDLKVSDVGSSSYTVEFSLPKGNYATCLMREFMKSEMTDY